MKIKVLCSKCNKVFEKEEAALKQAKRWGRVVQCTPCAKKASGDGFNKRGFYTK